MPDLAALSRLLLGRLRRCPEGPPVAPGVGAVLDAPAAIALAESWAAVTAFESTGDPRQDLSAALGAAAAGLRVSVHLPGGSLAGVGDLLARAASLHLPLVVHVADADPRALAEAGPLVLVAADPQEAVDLALVARRTAEAALVPAVVATHERDVRDLRIPGPETLKALLGHPADRVPPPTPAQKMLFGASRRRVPKAFDASNPMLLGAPADLSEAGAGPYFEDFLPALMEESLEALQRLCGRRPDPVFAEGLEGAALAVLACGPAILPLRAVARFLPKVGVVGLRVLRPLPDLARLRTAKVVAVLGGAPHLPREVHEVRLAGPARPADLAALCRRLAEGPGTRLHLGVDFPRPDPDHPDLQALHDRIARDLPGIAVRGVRAHEPAPDLRPEGALSVLVRRRSGDPLDGLAERAAGLLHRALGRRVLARPQAPKEPWGEPLVDRLTVAPTEILDDEGPADVLVLGDPTLEGLPIRDGGAVLLAGVLLPPEVRRPLEDRGVKVYAAPDGPRETVLGALAATLRRHGLVDREPRHFLAAHEGGPEFEQGLHGLDGAPPMGPPPSATPRGVPAALRRRPGGDDPAGALPRFFRQAYEPHRRDTLAVGPQVALGAVPPLTSSFRDLAPLRTTLPVFDSSLCTGCGDCWPACPEGALRPLILGPGDLLEAGMALAGPEASPLRALTAKLTTRMARCLQGETPPATAGDLLCAAYARAAEGVTGERREALDRALTAVADAVRVLPLARTDRFFWEGPGETVSVVLDPAACKACGACVAACEPGALPLHPQTPENLEAARRLARLADDLPDPSEASRSLLPPLAALLARRDLLRSVAGGDGAEPGSGEKQALRLALAVAEAVHAPLARRRSEEVAALRERLGQAVRDLLAGALPADDLEALAEGLRTLERGPVALADLAARMDGALAEGRVDGDRLATLVEAARRLADLQWTLDTGEGGAGATPYALALAPGLPWATTWPSNPFRVPVLAGASAAMARGLAEARLHEFQEAREAVLQAREALGERGDADETETPLVLAGPEAVLAADPGLPGLLASNLPVKVVVLADPAGDAPSLALSALPRATVLQASPTLPDHLVAGLEEVFASPAPALVRLPAGDPEVCRHAVETRAFPVWRSTPGGPVDLSGNPEPAGDWGSSPRRLEEWALLQALAGPAPSASAEVGEDLLRHYEERLERLRGEVEDEIAERVRTRLLALAGYR